MNEKFLEYLNADPLRHLVQLKYLNLYADDIQCFYVNHGEEMGMMISHLPAMTSWDAQAYAAAKMILLPVATGEAAAIALCNYAVEQFPDLPVVLKFCDRQTSAIFEQVFRLRQAKTLVSFTADKTATFAVSDDVVISSNLDEQCTRLYLKNGYTQEELHKFFRDGAKSFSIYEADEVVCSCLIYRNFGSIWEIGGVHTIESARRKGYARRVVQASLQEILKQGWRPRYQVDQKNIGSIRLAESLGLVPCLYFEHYWGE